MDKAKNQDKKEYKINVVDPSNMIIATATTTASEAKSIIKSLKIIPEKMNVSQSHSINTLKKVVTGASNNRVSQRITVTIDEYETLFSAKCGRREGFKTQIDIFEFGSIKHLIDVKMAKLLDVIFYNLDKQGNTKGYIQFPLSEYLEYRQLSVNSNTKKDITKELKPILKALHNFSISSEEKGRKSFLFIRPFSAAGLEKGIITVGLDRIFVESIDKRYFEIPKKIGKLRSTAYNMANYIYLYSRQANKIQFDITNEVLYEYSGLPRYEEVSSSLSSYCGATTKAIIEPFQRALFEIVNILGEENITITETEFEPGKWETFLKSKVFITLRSNKNLVSIAKARQKAKTKNKQK